MVDLIVPLGTLALMSACATIAGAAEDLESDFGSQSNANSQVQLAPQVGFIHRIYNKAICGEPVAYGFLCATAAALALALHTAFYINIVIALALGAAVASLMYGVYATTAYMGRLTGQKRFGQPIYLDILLTTTPSIIVHAFIASMGIATFSYLLNTVIGQPFPFVILAMLWGVMAGGMGSAVGDVHYGAEREYQNKPFGQGLPAAQSGKIIQKGEAGLRNSIDIAGYCVKHGAPLTGLGLGITVFADLWRHIIFINYANGWAAMLAGLILVVLWVIFSWIMEVWTRNTYGPYKTEEAA
ncbi:MAG TPA: tetrahydromethanopterin S-methyltransferase subunit E [Methanocella sp.]|nr:tetrahydromethanopterin S-methyltransferase subunit E [Methanocella sp.]